MTLMSREEISVRILLSKSSKTATNLSLYVRMSVICRASCGCSSSSSSRVSHASGVHCWERRTVRELLLTCRANAVRHFSRTTLIRPACLPSSRGPIPTQDDSKFDLLIWTCCRRRRRRGSYIVPQSSRLPGSGPSCRRSPGQPIESLANDVRRQMLRVLTGDK